MFKNYTGLKHEKNFLSIAQIHLYWKKFSCLRTDGLKRVVDKLLKKV